MARPGYSTPVDPGLPSVKGHGTGERMNTRVLAMSTVVATLALLLTGCFDDPEPQPSSQPTLTVPTLTIPTITPAPGDPVPQHPQPPPGGGGGGNQQYPLSAAEAQSYLGAGVAVAGLLPDGDEVRAYKTTTTVYEDQQVPKEVCEPEYNNSTGEYETECRTEYVTEQVATQKAIFQIASSFTMLDFDNALAAITKASSFGVTGWKTT